ncbi:MAG: BON domain-containing protein [Granulicella sp.]
MKKFGFRFAASAVVALIFAAQGFSQTAVDDSAHNKEHQTTADSQSNAKADRQMTAKVRRAIIADKELSTYAHNVKIITLNGTVTLKGPVKSEEEKQKVSSDAASVTSADAIKNELTVK